MSPILSIPCDPLLYSICTIQKKSSVPGFPRYR
nr:MAG TPA: hypothetical protein [Caudoviricetes sp.]